MFLIPGSSSLGGPSDKGTARRELGEVVRFWPIVEVSRSQSAICEGG